MNIAKFIEALNETEQEEVFDLLRKIRHERLKKKVSTFILTSSDKELAKTDKIAAIKAVRNRNQSTLLEAKLAIDNFLDN